MNGDFEGADYKALYETSLVKLEQLQRALNAKKKELKLLNHVRQLQAKYILDYEKQIQVLGGKVEKRKYKL